MKNKSIWMAVVNDTNIVVFVKGCSSQQKAESAIVKYLQKNEKFDGQDFAEACFWIGEKDLRLDLMVFEMKAKDFDDIRLQTRLLIEPPPKEKGLYRVVYVIDVSADNFVDAAKKAHETMIDPDSLAPVLEVFDQLGKVIKIDLSKSN